MEDKNHLLVVLNWADNNTRCRTTIPVHYPWQARQRLHQACLHAGIEVSHFFFEPIAAIYCNLASEPVSGVTAVFDWGGGSLDIATVQIQDRVVLTRQIDGWHRGGTDFDRLICEQALNGFLHAHPQPALTAESILDRLPQGRRLELRAEDAKIDLNNRSPVLIDYNAFLRGANLEFNLTRNLFRELIEPDVSAALARLERALRATGVTPRTLARLYLSGGTCNVSSVRERLAAQVAGNRTVTSLQVPAHLRHPSAGGGLNDIGNATALGAALLAVHGANPVFASALGVRLADAAGDRFYPVYRANELISFAPQRAEFFVSDAGRGVARLLICDQDEPALQPGGRLLRVVPVPIDEGENWLDVTFTLDSHLVLRIEASGRKVRARVEPTHVQHLNLGFRIPPQPAVTPPPRPLSRGRI
jgi:molecular chaperone DnaK